MTTTGEFQPLLGAGTASLAQFVLVCNPDEQAFPLQRLSPGQRWSQDVTVCGTASALSNSALQPSLGKYIIVSTVNSL